jgi:alcohol dehydrogenase class IV
VAGVPPVIKLSRYAFEGLRKDEEFILHCGRSKAVQAVKSLITDVGMPARLGDLRVTGDRFDQIAREALDQLDCPANPRKNAEANLKSILVEAF